jgi:hypothetical protein
MARDLKSLATPVLYLELQAHLLILEFGREVAVSWRVLRKVERRPLHLVEIILKKIRNLLYSAIHLEMNQMNTVHKIIRLVESFFL